MLLMLPGLVMLNNNINNTQPDELLIMLENQILALHDTSRHLLERAKSSTKASEAERYTNSALACIERAQALMDSTQLNSCLLYLECRVTTRHDASYEDYVVFCARNNLTSLSRPDWDSCVLLALNAKKGSDGTTPSDPTSPAE